MNWLRPRLEPLFGIDLRTLALFRALLGLLLCADVCRRLADARAFYSDAGVLPRGWLAQSGDPWHLSLYLLNGGTWFAVLLLAAQALAALALALGWRSRLAALACFVLQASLLNRNPLLAGAGDTLLACLLFWAMFLPLGARWSVDAALMRDTPPLPDQHLSWASAALLLQALAVFFFDAVLQNGPEWHDGSALGLALQLDALATPAGVWLRQYPALLHSLTGLVWWLQLLGPLLALSPLFNRPLRFAAMLLLLALQAGYALCFELGPYPWACAAGLTVLTGGWVWDALDRRARHREQRRGALPLRIYYDRGCDFCLKCCLLLRTLLILPRAEIVPAQDYARARALLEANRSWVVIDHDDHAALKWPALVLLLRRSPWLGWLGWLLSGPWAVPPGNAVYDLVGRHRQGLARISAALLPWRAAPAAGAGPLPQRAAAVLLFAVLAWNLAGAGWLPGFTRAALAPPLKLLRLEQDWNLFAPAPGRDDGWFVFPGELADGTALDVLRPGQSGVSYEPPRYLSQGDPDYRWHQYRAALWPQALAGNRAYYGRYLCRQWNHAHPQQQALKDFKMIFMLQPAQPPGQPRTLEQRVLQRYECGADNAAQALPLPVN